MDIELNRKIIDAIGKAMTREQQEEYLRDYGRVIDFSGGVRLVGRSSKASNLDEFERTHMERMEEGFSG